MKREATERAKLLAEHGDLQYLSADRMKCTFARAKHGMLRIGRSEGLPEYIRNESAVRRLCDEYFNDPESGNIRMKAGTLSG